MSKWISYGIHHGQWIKCPKREKLKSKNMGANGMNTPAPINYETALPQGVGKLVQARRWFYDIGK